MPDIRHKETVNKVAYGYCTNGENMYQAMINADYSHNYANTHAKEVLGNIRVKEAIKRITEQLQVENESAIEFGKREHLRLKLLCEQKGDMVNATRNLEGYMRSNGAYTDNINTADTTEQRKLTEKEQEQARRVANIMLREGIGEVKGA